MASFVINADGDLVGAGGFMADAPANGWTILLPLLASDIERTDPASTVDYEVIADNETGDTAFEDEVDGRASLSVFARGVGGDCVAMNLRRDSGLLDLAVDIDSQADAPSLGSDDRRARRGPEASAPADLVPVGICRTDRRTHPAHDRSPRHRRGLSVFGRGSRRGMPSDQLAERTLRTP